MTVKLNLIQKSFFVSFLLLLILISSVFIEIPFKNIITLADIIMLVLLSVLQMVEIIRMKKIIIKTSAILSSGNERDFSILKQKDKNIIDYKVTNLIEQLEDSVKQSNQILNENDKLVKEIDVQKKSLENIQKTINREVIEIKSHILNNLSEMEKLIADITDLKKNCNIEDSLLNNLIDVYSSFGDDFEKINHSINTSKDISDREINRSDQVIESISSLYDKSESNAEKVNTIFKGIDDIREVTDFINEVAEKASILSLNAAIESAHAGDAGKGFAVVAEEVGVLASNTAEHAENINNALYSVSDLISESKKNDVRDFNSYPALIKDLKSINSAFTVIKELLTELSFLKEPKTIDIKRMKTKDKNTLELSVNTLNQMRNEMEESVERIGKLTLIENYTESGTEQQEKMKIHETAVKPAAPETTIEL